MKLEGSLLNIEEPNGKDRPNCKNTGDVKFDLI